VNGLEPHAVHGLGQAEGFLDCLAIVGRIASRPADALQTSFGEDLSDGNSSSWYLREVEPRFGTRIFMDTWPEFAQRTAVVDAPLIANPSRARKQAVARAAQIAGVSAQYPVSLPYWSACLARLLERKPKRIELCGPPLAYRVARIRIACGDCRISATLWDAACRG
jgi:hypothetical protein